MWHSNPGGVPQGIALEPVSMGKGFIQWRVVYPSLVKKNRHLQAKYDSFDDACKALVSFCRREELDTYTADQVETNCRETGVEASWGAQAASS